MKVIDAGISGKTSKSKVQKKWSDLNLSANFRKIVEILNPQSEPRPIQALAFGKKNILENRRNLIASAPTNGGKSLVATLLMLDTVRQGRRTILLEPLRALAREKYNELNQALPKIEKVLKRKLTVRITTGDYRLDNEYFHSPPPDIGEIIIATPERLESILRNPDYDDWVRSIGSVCLDEAHLISSNRRGPTFEYLLTAFLCLPVPPRIILLSASLGSTDKAQEWLTPCDEIKVTDRFPSLHKEVLELTEDEDANEIIQKSAFEILRDPSSSLLIFVYQTKSAEKLAGILNKWMGDLAGRDGAIAFHSQMSSQKREKICQSFTSGASRCLVTTTSLSLGVNLPCTHVIVRDCVFPGAGALSVPELLQMLGRAGRGDHPGQAAVIVRPSDRLNAEELAFQLRNESLPELCSSFDTAVSKRRNRKNIQNQLLPSATPVAIQIARSRDIGVSLDHLLQFFDRSLGGKSLSSQIPAAIDGLINPTNALIFLNQSQKYKVTKLGAKALQSTLPLDFAAGYAQLLRDIMYLDRDGQLLTNWRQLDHLIVLELLSPQPVRLRPFSKKMVGQVDSWIEKSPESYSLLFSNWIRGEQNFSRADELIGSLNIIKKNPAGTHNIAAYKQAYLAVFRAAVLFERGQGISEEQIRRKLNVENIGDIEERWRDTNLWLLSGISVILDLRCFYHHLIEECGADRKRIQNTKQALGKMREQVFTLLDLLKYCSPLGSFLTQLRGFYNGKAKIGHQTIRRLESAGINNIQDIASLQEPDFVSLGISKTSAKQITNYIMQRLKH